MDKWFICRSACFSGMSQSCLCIKESIFGTHAVKTFLWRVWRKVLVCCFWFYSKHCVRVCAVPEAQWSSVPTWAINTQVRLIMTDDDTRWKAKVTTKYLGFILMEAWMDEIHSGVVKTFHTKGNDKSSPDLIGVIIQGPCWSVQKESIPLLLRCFSLDWVVGKHLLFFVLISSNQCRSDKTMDPTH